MLRRILDLPLLVILMGMAALAMYLPAAHAASLGQHVVARPFFYAGTILFMLVVMIAIATSNRPVRADGQGHLWAFLGAYLVLPPMLALPFSEVLRDTTFLNAWFEMLSAFTTTGATLYDTPGRLPDSLHLWRALVGWLGGFFMLVMALAVLAPRNLGGAEVTGGTGFAVPGGRVLVASERVTRQALILFPAYGGVTLLLWLGLVLAGNPGLVALCHAMSTLSTSGIVPEIGPEAAPAGRLGEAMILLGLLFAASSRLLPGLGRPQFVGGNLWRDAELLLALAIVALVAVLLSLRHWNAAFQLEAGGDLMALLRTLWGMAFNTLSFLTTTGFVSSDWTQARAWSGLETHGLVLLGLAIVGGGAATTAGGVKLLRVYALLVHGQREMERLIHPSSVGGSGRSARRLRREGAYLAWIFFMLFAMSIGAAMAALTLVGQSFQTAMVLAISALTTTGPLATLAADAPLAWSGLDSAAKVILGLTMVLGRVEVLAVLVLLAPAGWRR